MPAETVHGGTLWPARSGNNHTFQNTGSSQAHHSKKMHADTWGAALKHVTLVAGEEFVAGSRRAIPTYGYFTKIERYNHIPGKTKQHTTGIWQYEDTYEYLNIFKMKE